MQKVNTVLSSLFAFGLLAIIALPGAQLLGVLQVVTFTLMAFHFARQGVWGFRWLETDYHQALKLLSGLVMIVSARLLGDADAEKHVQKVLTDSPMKKE
jgi:hypothetical protein